MGLLRSDYAVALISGIAVALAVCVARALGLLQGAELIVFDRLVTVASSDLEVAREVAVVEVTEKDIQELDHYPFNDQVLAEVLRRILDGGATAVGLDIYRDLAVPPGRKMLDALLESEDRVVAIYHSSETPTPPPPILIGTDQVGFNDIPIDGDGTLRRALLYQRGVDGGVETSFALRLALRHLAANGVFPEADPEDSRLMRIGQATLPWFGEDDGGYVGADAGGYQFLLSECRTLENFQRIPLTKVLRGETDSAVFRDRVVLVGVTAESVQELVEVPCGKGTDQIRGVEFHANAAIELIRVAMGASRPLRVSGEATELGLILLFALAGSLLGVGIRQPALLAAGLAGGLGALWLGGHTSLRLGWWIPLLGPAVGWGGGLTFVAVWTSSRERAQRAQLMRLFSRHVSPEIANQLWDHRDEFLHGGRLRPQRLTATVLFVDMRGYTANAEKMDPADLMEWVNHFMETMGIEVSRFGGIVDDYFGDGMKANFGVPFPRENPEEIAQDALNAVHCAQAMALRLRQLNEDYRAQGRPTIGIRIGVHSGPMIAGELGEEEKGLSYTTVGSAPIVAQRLEGLDRVSHDFDTEPCRILISGATRDLIGEEIPSESLGTFSLKGMTEQMAVYRVREKPAESEPVHSADPPDGASCGEDQGGGSHDSAD